MNRTTRQPITLFTEVETAELVKLLDRADVQALWGTGRFGLAVAVIDLSAERARAIRALEAQGVEVTAWLLLGPADGYWLNADNADLAAARFRELDDFANEHGLRLARIGLDIEPPRADMDALLTDGLPALVRLIRQRRDRASIKAAEASYANLCGVIRRSGRRVESYCLPPIVDEARVGSTLLRRVLGTVDPPVDDRVLMAYSARSLTGAPRAEFTGCTCSHSKDARGRGCCRNSRRGSRVRRHPGEPKHWLATLPASRCGCCLAPRDFLTDCVRSSGAHDASNPERGSSSRKGSSSPTAR